MPVDSASSRRYSPRQIFIGVLLAVAVYAAWQMTERPLWGWWPLVLELSAWMALAMIVFPKRPAYRKWFGGATLTGLLLGLGFPPSPLTFLVFVAWVPLLAMENSVYLHEERIRPKRIFLLAFHAFALWNIIATFWVINTALMAGLVANFLNAALMAGAFTLYHVIRRRIPASWAAFAFIGSWIGFEYLHLFWDISWPWLTLGNAMAQYPWAVQWYEWTGVFGGSWWILGVNFMVCAFLLRRKHARPVRWMWIPLMLLGPVAVSLALWFTVKESDNDPVPVTVVQPNYEPHYEKFDVPEREQLERFLGLTIDHIAAETEYIVFPETSFDGVRLNSIRDNRPIRLFSELLDSLPGTRLITGISSYRILDGAIPHPKGSTRKHVDRQGDTLYWDAQNAAIQIASGEPDIPVYFKSKLVPGPEMYPFRRVLFFLGPLIDKLGGTIEGNTKQRERSVFTGGRLNVAPVICYESIYGAYCGGYVEKGATAFFIVTNDGWWDNTPGHIQHLKIGALRAIEHRRPIARSANTGISCFIDLRGRVRQATLYGETTAIQGEVVPETRITLYTRIGDVAAWIAIGLLAVCIFLAIFMRPKANASSPAHA